MRNALALAMVAVTAAPFLGIWRGHLWAKLNGCSLRDVERSTSQIA